MPDPVEGAATLLAASSPVTALLGSSPAFPDGWVFQWKLWEQIEGSSKSAIVLTSHSWGGSGHFHSHKTARLQVEVYSDPDRDTATNQVMTQNAAQKVKALYALIDPLLNFPQGGYIAFGDMPIITSERLADIDITDTPLGDYMVRGTVSYGLTHP